jgi:hypothetical protein
MNSIPVTSAYFHTQILIPGTGFQDTSMLKERTPDAKMSLTPMGLMIELKGKQALVPHANIKCMVLAESEKK